MPFKLFLCKNWFAAAHFRKPSSSLVLYWTISSVDSGPLIQALNQGSFVSYASSDGKSRSLGLLVLSVSQSSLILVVICVVFQKATVHGVMANTAKPTNSVTALREKCSIWPSLSDERKSPKLNLAKMIFNMKVSCHYCVVCRWCGALWLWL